MDFLLRPAQISDLEQILAIYNAEILDGTANWNNTTKSSADFQLLSFALPILMPHFVGVCYNSLTFS